MAPVGLLPCITTCITTPPVPAAPRLPPASACAAAARSVAAAPGQCRWTARSQTALEWSIPCPCCRCWRVRAAVTFISALATNYVHLSNLGCSWQWHILQRQGRQMFGWRPCRVEPLCCATPLAPNAQRPGCASAADVSNTGWLWYLKPHFLASAPPPPSLPCRDLMWLPVCVQGTGGVDPLCQSTGAKELPRLARCQINAAYKHRSQVSGCLLLCDVAEKHKNLATIGR